MFSRKNSKSSATPKGIHRRAASMGSATTMGSVTSMGSAPRLFVSPPSLLRKTSRNDQRVRKAPCAVVVDDATISADQQQPPQKAAVGFFVNPPSFRIDQAPQPTLGVPMMGKCSDFYHAPAKQLAKPSGPQRVVSTGSTSSSKGRVLVNPPAFATAVGGGGGRIRKTWGVPMV